MSKRRSKVLREDIVPPDDLGLLLAETNFTRREIVDFYRYATGKTITKRDFGMMCFDNGIKNASLVNRIWKLWDSDADGDLSEFELVKGLNPLLRGDRSELAAFFFDVYDVDGNADLTSPEVIAVMSDMLQYTNGDDSEGLTSKQRNRLCSWVKQNQNEQGRLDKDTFIQVVMNMEANQEKPSLLSWRSVYFIFLTAWFEIGTSFVFPAMGALSDRIKDRFLITDEGIGTLTSAYFFAAMVGPLVGGYAMDKHGPGIVVVGANVIVMLGAILQASANGKHQFWLVLIGRLLLGFGGEVTPFTTIEILGRLFPDHFGLMAGVRNLIQSLSGFLAFVLLPIWADSFEDEEKGTSFALWMCAILAFVSLSTSTIVHLSMRKEHSKVIAEKRSDQKYVTKFLRAFTLATAPRAPGWRRWLMPVSFFFAVFGIKAQYFAPFGFTAFSNEIYKDKFNQSPRMASFLSGYISLVAGLMSPTMGAWSDKLGKRSFCLIIASALSLVGFGILASSSGGLAPLWVASTLFAVQYGFGDTVAYISIRFIVGTSRAGLGYGIYGVLGNLIATLVPLFGGYLIESSNGIDKVLWYFTGLMGMGTICWVGVFLLEGPRSLLELPVDLVIETCDEDLKLAALSYVASPAPTTASTRLDDDCNLKIDDEHIEMEFVKEEDATEEDR